MTALYTNGSRNNTHATNCIPFIYPCSSLARNVWSPRRAYELFVASEMDSGSAVSRSHGDRIRLSEGCTVCCV